ncbi:MAG: sodium/solute symporter [Kiritimatiellae bacterium]|nr:sodium/solute symporter [Kiritimatiellia bacterium]
MNIPLTTLDIAVLGVYAVLLIGVGLVMGKKVRNAGDFFSGGKKVPWWMGAISSYMAMISSFVFIAYAQIGYEDGLVGLVVFWSTAFAILVGTFVFARRWQRANLATPVEYLERRYGPGARQVVSWCGVAFRVLDNTVRLYTLGIIASQFLGVSLPAGIVLGALAVLAYTLAGGLWSVVVTDIVQCAVLMAVAVTVLPLSLNAVGGICALYEKVPEHFSLFNGHRGTLWFLAAYYLIVFIKYNGSWSFVQRLASVPNERDAVKMGLLSAAIFFVFPVFAVLPAVAARVCLPDLPPELHERSYIEMCSRLLPPGMLGLMVAAMFAASLSTLAAEFNVTSGVFTTDIYRRLFRRNAGEREILLVARLSTLGVATLIAFGALFVSGLGGAFEANKLLMALFGVPIVIPSVFGILWKGPNTKGVYLCIALGVVSGILLKSCWSDLSWEAGTLIQIAVCFAGFFGGALLGTPKKERENRDCLFATLGFSHKERKEHKELCASATLRENKDD